MGEPQGQGLMLHLVGASILVAAREVAGGHRQGEKDPHANQAEQHEWLRLLVCVEEDSGKRDPDVHGLRPIGMTILDIVLPGNLVSQSLVCFDKQVKLLVGFGVVGVLIRMSVPGQGTVGLLDFLLRCVSGKSHDGEGIKGRNLCLGGLDVQQQQRHKPPHDHEDDVASSEHAAQTLPQRLLPLPVLANPGLVGFRLGGAAHLVQGVWHQEQDHQTEHKDGKEGRAPLVLNVVLHLQRPAVVSNN
mmetsp:Transcript_15025/g.42166  ORF Transcript_15025/g.42166 Transcript_15025/m.42166 type:complete len:245 (-) Transcript_15025:83-817(-)